MIVTDYFWFNKLEDELARLQCDVDSYDLLLSIYHEVKENLLEQGDCVVKQLSALEDNLLAQGVVVTEIDITFPIAEKDMSIYKNKVFDEIASVFSGFSRYQTVTQTHLLNFTLFEIAVWACYVVAHLDVTNDYYTLQQKLAYLNNNMTNIINDYKGKSYE